MAAKKRWTYKQKAALSKAIEKLSEDDHKLIYKIIKARDPDCIKECPEETSVSFNLLSLQTLGELECFVASHSVNTQSEKKESNPAEHEKEESSSESTSNIRKSPRKSEKKESNPAEHEKEESSSESTSNTRKSPREKGATGSAEKTEEVSIKARPRETSRISEASHSK